MEQAPADTQHSPIVADRSCGTCTLCCKVLSINEFEKPQGRWCDHCAVGTGCRIYKVRPDECRRFYCGYLTAPEVSEDWKPSRSKMVLVSELEGKRIAVHVDPGRPSAWRSEPYYSDLKSWAVAAVADMNQVVVQILNRAIVILPEKDVDLGFIAVDEVIMTSERQTPVGIELGAVKLKKDDPRLKSR